MSTLAVYPINNFATDVMENVAVCVKNKAQKMKAAVMAKDKGGKEIIVELGFAAIAVALLLAYRTEINGLVTGIMSQATTTIGNLFTI